MENLAEMNNKIILSLIEYINELKKKIFLIKENLPEFWMHEDLKEIQILYRTIEELKKIIKQYAVDYDEKDNELEKIKSWLYSDYGRGVI